MMRKPIPKLPKKPTAGKPTDTILSSVWWNKLWLYLKAIQPLYPDNLTIVSNMNGTISCRRTLAGSTAASSTGDTYNGMFKVIDTSTESEQKISVVDGLDETAQYAGRIQVNGFVVSVPQTELTVTESGYICLEASLLGDPATAAQVVVKFYTALPDYADGYACQLISQVNIIDGTLSFSQEFVTQFMFIIGKCADVVG